MSVLQGGKGARQRRADERYYAAVGRQLLMHDRGFYEARNVFGEPVWLCDPAPVEDFLRKGDRIDRIDFRSWAVKA